MRASALMHEVITTKSEIIFATAVIA